MISNWQIRRALKVVKNGGVIAYPTESVYGLGCDPNNLKAIKRLLDLKQRSYKKGLIIVAANIQQAFPFLQPLSKKTSQQIDASIGQHITWLLPAAGHVPELICGKFPGKNKKIALRVTPFPLIKNLCDQLDGPLISTSANLSGKQMTYSAMQVRLQFKDQLELILNGPLGSQTSPSEIRDALSGEVYRTKI